MSISNLIKNISIFKQMNKGHKVALLPIVEVTLSDQYDLRFLGKQELKKLTTRELQALIRYATEYIGLFQTGKFMYRKNKYGWYMADYDEYETYRGIIDITKAMSLELGKRA